MKKSKKYLKLDKEEIDAQDTIINDILLSQQEMIGEKQMKYSNEEKSFFIKEGYVHRKQYHHFDDTKNSDEWQDCVYSKAKSLLESKKYQSVLDIGCGSGFKLIKYFDAYNTIGLELEENLSFLQKKYPNKKWMISNFEKKLEEDTQIVICSDVIEHLVNPDTLLNFLYEIDFEICVMSTPERDVIRGKDSLGPPENLAHVREWNKIEFYTYINQNFNILEHYVDEARTGSGIKSCQIIVFEKRSKQ